MNRADRKPCDFSWVVVSVCKMESLLIDYCTADPGCKRLELERLSASTEALQTLVDELEIDLTIQQSDLGKVGQTVGGGFSWDSEHFSTYYHLTEKFARPDGLG
jgi:hypothetical protein